MASTYSRHSAGLRPSAKYQRRSDARKPQASAGLFPQLPRRSTVHPLRHVFSLPAGVARALRPGQQRNDRVDSLASVGENSAMPKACLIEAKLDRCRVLRVRPEPVELPADFPRGQWVTLIGPEEKADFTRVLVETIPREVPHPSQRPRERPSPRSSGANKLRDFRRACR